MIEWSEIIGEFWFPIVVVTIFYGVIFLCSFLLCAKSKRITRACIMMTAFCMWIFWLVVYMSQINPLFGPLLLNNTLIWMGEKWGDKDW